MAEQTLMSGKVIITDPDQITESGLGTHTIQKFFQFLPDDPVPQRMQSFRCRGIGQQLSDGSFHFVPVSKRKNKSQLLKKLPHGKLSKTADGCYQLTLKIPIEESTEPLKVLLKEAKEALKENLK